MFGAFHIEGSIFSAISKIIEGSRGSYLVTESGVTAPESVNRFLKGKTYNRCGRSYIILSIALHESHFESFLMDTHTDIDFTDELKVWLGTKSDQLPISRMELSNQYQKQNINSVVQKINSTANDLNSDLIKISDWAFQWKMRFNPDPKKQAQEVIFSRKINKIDHPPLYFNENLVKSSSTQKHLGMILDTKLDFSLHLKNVQNKVNKTIGLLRKLQDTLPRTSLITIFKSFIRPHLDCVDIIYDQSYNTSFLQNI